MILELMELKNLFMKNNIFESKDVVCCEIKEFVSPLAIGVPQKYARMSLRLKFLPLSVQS